MKLLRNYKIFEETFKKYLRHLGHNGQQGSVYKLKGLQTI